MKSRKAMKATSKNRMKAMSAMNTKKDMTAMKAMKAPSTAKPNGTKKSMKAITKSVIPSQCEICSAGSRQFNLRSRRPRRNALRSDVLAG